MSLSYTVIAATSILTAFGISLDKRFKAVYDLYMHNIQQRILEYLSHTDFSDLTLREIAERIGLPKPVNPQKVKHHLEQLERKGLILYDRKNKYVQGVKQNQTGTSDFYNIPIYGEANCGKATILSIQNLEGYLKVSKSYLPSIGSLDGLFALKAVGNSMNDSHVSVIGKPSAYEPILDGDFLIINGNDRSPQNGKYFLSIIDNCANIKKLIVGQRNEVILKSESTEDFAPIFIHEDDQNSYFINGIVVGVLKAK